MARAPKVCGHATCCTLVPAGTTYCAEHARQRGWQRNTGVTRTDTAAHRKRRLRVLARDNHQCQLRYDGICVGTASVCDHRMPLAEGGSDDDANCQAACMACHNRKTSIEGHRARGHTVPSGPPTATKPAGVAGESRGQRRRGSSCDQ